MVLLKQLRVKFKSGQLALELKRIEKEIECYSTKESLRASDVQIYREQREILPKKQAELQEKGEATKISAFGLPIASNYNGAEREFEWTIYDTALQGQATMPLALPLSPKDAEQSGFDLDRYSVWIFESKVYLASDTELTALDVRALVNQDQNKRRLALEKAHALQAMSEQLDKPRQREHISREVRIEVWQRDAGRCVECAAQESLEFDHIIPFAMGGSNTVRNLQLLCGDCNRRKGMTLG